MSKFQSVIATLAIAVLVIASAAQAKDYKDAVHTQDGTVVFNTFENCVTTQWDSSSDECKGRVKLAERTIYFEFGKDTLTAQSKEKLDRLVKKLRGASNISAARVVGYADEIGNASANQSLSSRRAKTVENYLRNRVKLPFARREVRGLGETGSQTNCSDSMPRHELIECLAADRRVEIELNYTR